MGAYQYFKLNYYKDTNQFMVENAYDFISLEGMELRLQWLHHGKVKKQKNVKLHAIEPGVSQLIPLPTVLDGEDDVVLVARVYRKKATTYSEKNHLVAHADFVLSAPKLTAVELMKEGVPLDAIQGEQTLSVSNSRVGMTFDMKTGRPTSLKLNGKEMFVDGQGFLFDNHRWIENDRFGDTDNGLDESATEVICTAIPQSKPQGGIATLDLKPEDCMAYVVHTDRKGKKADVQIDYHIFAQGIIEMVVTIVPHNGNLRRAGLACAIDSTLSRVRYYGKGPWENAPDRSAGVVFGRYDTHVDALREPYMKPQSGGDRAVYQVMLTNANGQGMEITSDKLFFFSSNRFTDKDLMDCNHEWELQPRPYLYLHLDAAQRGLGNASCGPGPMQKYTIPHSTPITYRLRIKGVE